MFRTYKNHQSKALNIVLLLAITFFVSFINVRALTLEESKLGYAIDKLATGSISITYERDIVTFPNSNYQEYGISITYANVLRTLSDGSVYKYYSGSFNTTLMTNGGATAFISSPNTPNPIYDGDSSILWIKGSDGIVKKYGLTLSSSCEQYIKSNSSKTTIQVHKCGKYNYSTGKVEYDSAILNIQDTIACYDGYERTSSPTLISNNCPDVASNSYGLNYRLCSQVYQFSCTKKGTESAKLTTLSLSTGTISPKFSSSVYSYTATVDAETVNINAAVNSMGTFVTDFGARTVNLNYGLNSILVKIKSSSGNITTYSIKITRPDSRSNVNTLSAITSSVGTLTPAFDSTILNYDLYVPEETTSVAINATRTDQNSIFLDGFGSREVTLTEASTMVYVKVISALGTYKTYAIVVKKGDVPPENTTDALLKSIEVGEESLAEFAENTYEYNKTVPYETSFVIVNAYPKTEGDTVEVKNVEELAVGPNIIEIKVTTPKKYVRTYTLNIIRKEQDLNVEKNPEIKDIKIAGYTFNYEPNETEYDLKLKKGDTSLKITVTPVGKKSVVTIEDNKDLRLGSKITINSVAENGAIATYEINIIGVEKGTNMVLVVFLIILIGGLIVYAVLRLLGYKVYFNFSLIGSMFRSIGQKIKNIFDR